MQGYKSYSIILAKVLDTCNFIKNALHHGCYPYSFPYFSEFLENFGAFQGIEPLGCTLSMQHMLWSCTGYKVQKFDQKPNPYSKCSSRTPMACLLLVIKANLKCKLFREELVGIIGILEQRTLTITWTWLRVILQIRLIKAVLQ